MPLSVATTTANPMTSRQSVHHRTSAGACVAAAASLYVGAMTVREYHVITRIGGGWSVYKRGASRASRSFQTKRDAVNHARDVARRAGAELVIHEPDGTLDRRVQYGGTSDPSREVKR